MVTQVLPDMPEQPELRPASSYTLRYLARPRMRNTRSRRTRVETSTRCKMPIQLQEQHLWASNLSSCVGTCLQFEALARQTCKIFATVAVAARPQPLKLQCCNSPSFQASRNTESFSDCSNLKNLLPGSEVLCPLFGMPGGYHRNAVPEAENPSQRSSRLFSVEKGFRR